MTRPIDTGRTSLGPTAGESPFVSSCLTAASVVEGFGSDVAATLDWCRSVGLRAPVIGEGSTGELWELLATVAATDVSAARMLEPHLDALGILRQAGIEPGHEEDAWGTAAVGADARSTWGVFAAESADTRLEARHSAGTWTLTGTKPWCSLAGSLSHALVTASVDDTHRQLFAVDLRSAGVRPRTGPWHARGLVDVISAPVDFDDAAAVAVGDPGWYLTRPGFAWGGISVAACWWGAAVALSEALLAPARSPRADQLSHVHLGRVDAALWAGRAALAEAATLVDDRAWGAPDERLLAARVRSIVADAATLTLSECDAALGPAPLVSDPDFARRVADLHLYLRQHHGVRDSARIGRLLAGEGQ